VTEEYNRTQEDINKGNKFMEYLRNQNKDTISDKDVRNLIQDLFSDADYSNQNASKKKYDENYIKDSLEILRLKENKIICCITQLEEIQKNDGVTFRQLVANRKEKNKETKLNLQKEKHRECNSEFCYLNLNY